MRLFGPTRAAITEAMAEIHDFSSYAMDGTIGPKLSEIDCDLCGARRYSSVTPVLTMKTPGALKAASRM